MRFLHLSDLHLNIKRSDHDQKAVLDALCKDIEENVSKPIDLIFFTGDLIGKGAYTDDFEAKITEGFVDRILVAAKLTDESIVFCPGNHDVELSVRDDIYELGLQAKLSSKPSLHSFIDQHESHVNAFQVMQKYNKFSEKFGSGAALKRTPLFSSFKFNVQGVEVGVAALNSAWRATGRANDADCGSLLLGERQVEIAVEPIVECKVKIALMHHPLNWLAARDFQHVQRAIARNFDILLHGHVHETEGLSLVAPYSNLIVCGAGCLYQSREYFNGYSILEVDLPNNIFRQEAREYYSARHCFDSTARFSNNGIFESSLRGDSKDNLFLPEKSVERISDAINRQLVSSAISEVAPADIGDLFVEPRLSKLAPNKLEANASSVGKKLPLLGMPELELQGGSFFIWGRSESGKTTILNYLAVRVIRTTALSGKVAFVIDGRYITSVDSAIKAMVAFCDGAFKRSEIERALEVGRAVVFIDNCPLDAKTVEFTELVKFTRLYCKSKFIFSANEEARLTLVKNELPDLGIEVQELFLQPFTRKQVRTLIQKWFGHGEEECSGIVDEVLRLTAKLRLPRSPFLMSMVLWLSEKKIAFSPVNYATLIEGFIDGLLEKLSDSNFRSEIYTFRIKQHFLCELAAKLSGDPQKSISRLSLEQFSVDYFTSRPQPNAKPLELLDHFLARGVLFQVGDEIRFKLECFREYFVAKRMLENKNYLDECVSGGNLLTFINELDYYSGLKQDDIQLLEITKSRLDEYYKSSKLEIFSGDYPRVASHEASIINEIRDRMVDLVRLKPSVQERERILDDFDEAQFGKTLNVDTPAETVSGPTNHTQAKLLMYDEKYADYMRSLILTSKVLRNSELVGDADLIRKMFAICIEHWSKNVIFALAQLDILGSERGWLDSSDGKGIPPHALNAIRTIIPVFFVQVMKDSLGTGKLADVMHAFITDPANEELPVLLTTLLYGELGLPKYLDRIDDLLTRPNLVIGSREIVLVRLWASYLYKEISHSEQSRIEGILTELSKAVEVGPAPVTKAERAAYVKQIRDRLHRLRIVSPGAVQDQ
jgi:predicted MPP superfamily phosphohydrolase